MDTRGAGAPAVSGAPAPNTLYRRLTASPSAADAARVSADVQASFPGEPPFVPTLLGVFTWFAVGRYDSRVDALSTFQVALAAEAGASGVAQRLLLPLPCGLSRASDRAFV